MNRYAPEPSTDQGRGGAANCIPSHTVASSPSLERVIGITGAHRLGIPDAARASERVMVMRRFTAGVSLVWVGMIAAMGALTIPAVAQDDLPAPVVVELFTSQGCASCPPADALLAELAQQPHILPLALHVDYWDYIGWEDQFAQAAFTTRQKSYAHAAGRRMIYTPQMIVAGRVEVAGTKPERVSAAIAAERARPPVMRIDVKARADGSVRVRLVPLGPIDRNAEVIVVRYAPLRESEITRGENAGHTFHYVNVVTEWTVLGTWDAREPAEFDIPVPSSPQPGAVLVQVAGQGAILSAARLD